MEGTYGGRYRKICRWRENDRVGKRRGVIEGRKGHKEKTERKERRTEGREVYTVEPTNKGHYEVNDFVPCREVVPISKVK